jgi:hypothetical protein
LFPGDPALDKFPVQMTPFLLLVNDSGAKSSSEVRLDMREL